MNKIEIDMHGRMNLPAELKTLLGKDPLVSLSSSKHHLLLGRQGASETVVLAGFLGDMEVPDLLSFFNMFRKTGILEFHLGDGEKSLYFQHGEIVFATSTLPHEDLGELLFTSGKVERSALEQARRMAEGRTTLGRALVDRGAVTPEDLWLTLRAQVEEIVYHLFTVQSGSFAFRARSLVSDQIVRLSMSTQNIIMEALRRQDERPFFMGKIISLAYFPKWTDKLPTDLSADEKKIYTQARTGQLPARELFRKCGISEFEGMRLLYRLLEKQLLVMEAQASSAADTDLNQVLMIYNSLLKAIFSRVARKFDGFAAEVSLFLGGLRQPHSLVLRDVALNDDGTLDCDRVMKNLADLVDGDPKQLLAEALGELVYMESLTVRRELETEQAQVLIARVQEISARVKALVGRKE
jgi:hypothetical protein